MPTSVATMKVVAGDLHRPADHPSVEATTQLEPW